MAIIPVAFQFRYTFQIPQIPGPRTKGALLDLPSQGRIPFPSLLDGVQAIGELRLGWNREGLGVSLAVTGKKLPTFADSESPDQSDCLALWIDTRDTQTIHRASRFCHLFLIAPVGGGAKGKDPFIKQLPVPRAKDDAPTIDEDLVLLKSQVDKSGYLLEAWFPAKALHGYDPVSQPRLGFYAQIRDGELGKQALSVQEDFPFEGDPSLWSSLELVSAE